MTRKKSKKDSILEAAKRGARRTAKDLKRGGKAASKAASKAGEVLDENLADADELDDTGFGMSMDFDRDAKSMDTGFAGQRNQRSDDDLDEFLL